FSRKDADFRRYPPFLSSSPHEMHGPNTLHEGGYLEVGAVCAGRKRPGEGLRSRVSHGWQRQPTFPEVVKQLVDPDTGLDMHEAAANGASVTGAHFCEPVASAIAEPLRCQRRCARRIRLA